MKTRSIIICGVGGQGILTAGDLLSDVLMLAGFDVKKSEVHGMSQRGGDVICTVRYGDSVFSPLAPLGETEYILAFEKLEALRNINYLSARGVMMVNDFRWDPLPVSAGLEEYPEDIEEQLQRLAHQLVIIPATDMAGKLGNEKVSNVILLGLLACKTDIKKILWLQVISGKVPARLKDLNIQAFESGYQYK